MTDPRDHSPALADLDNEAVRRVDDHGDAGALLLDLVAAVDYLSTGIRHGLTIWDALEEALRWYTAETRSHIPRTPDPELETLPWDDPDPLKTVLTRLTTTPTIRGGTEQALQTALRRWLHYTATTYNQARRWPHPTSR